MKITILVNQKPHHIDHSTLSAAELRALAEAPGEYEVWKVVKSPDPEGKLPVDDVQVTGSIEATSGDRFRVVPQGTFGSAAAAGVENAAIDAAEELLEERGHRLLRGEHGRYVVFILESFRLPPGWSKSSTRILIKLPPSYPNGKLDMFWTDEELRLADGKVPDRADKTEAILGEVWRRFSWHTTTWTPGVDDVLTFLEFISRRFASPK